MNTLRITTTFSLFAALLIAIHSYGQDFYDINTINTVELTFTQSNWDALLDQLVANRQEERLLGTAVINGITYDSVGVRYKGNSSYNASNIKNPLNIKLDYVIGNQEHQGYGTLKLSNAYKDPSFVREVLSYEIAREYLPSSKANYCKVYINGTYIGLYTSVQDVDKHFMRTHYHSNDNPFFKGELVSGAVPTVVKVWGYLGADSSSYHNYYELESDEGWADLIDFLDTFNNDPSAMENVLNVDQHLWMLAYDILMVNLDAPINFGHNYYLYKDDTGRFNPVIWDLNENFGVFSRLLDGSSLTTTGMQQMDPFLYSDNSNYPILTQIFSVPTYKKMYVAHMKTIMDEFFANGRYRTRALELQNIIDAEIQADPNLSYSYSQFKSNIDNSISMSGGNRPGGQSSLGITELMEARLTYLNSQPEFQATQPTISNVTHSPTQLSSDSDVWITAEVQNSNIVQLAYRHSQTNIFKKMDMFDDGQHNDGSAGDGVFGVSVSVGASGMQYYIYSENQDAAAFSPARAAYKFYTIETTADLVINEFMASNDAAAADPNGEYDDWIELYNNSDSELSLAGYFLSDDGDELTKWTFPDISIAAHAYLIVWADSDEDQSGLHASFKLSASGEGIYLSNPDTVIINEITFSNQETDVSTGRYPNGTGTFVQMAPSFMASNESTTLNVDANNSETQRPQQLVLEQNYPNPFNPETTISYTLPQDTHVTVNIYNINGQLIRTLINSHQYAGTYSVVWDGLDQAGSQVVSGTYFYRIEAGTTTKTRRMIFLK